ncbi:hypothetical protein HanIR_Chr12g0578581 [Helianthus annuus]|nr:hypothetical protein HanIR_Chr12g0578581 [Helianthus annuus]
MFFPFVREIEQALHGSTNRSSFFSIMAIDGARNPYQDKFRNLQYRLLMSNVFNRSSIFNTGYRSRLWIWNSGDFATSRYPIVFLSSRACHSHSSEP